VIAETAAADRWLPGAVRHEVLDLPRPWFARGYPRPLVEALTLGSTRGSSAGRHHEGVSDHELAADLELVPIGREVERLPDGTSRRSF
jgi:hypothetical protein